MGKIKKAMDNFIDWAIENEDKVVLYCSCISAAGIGLIVGHEIGFKKGLDTGYSIGCIAGTNSVFSKMAMTIAGKPQH